MTDAQQDPASFMRWLAAQPSRTECCVECGAGRAELSAFMQSMFDRVVPTDISPPDETRQLMMVKQCGADDLPFPSNSVDLVFSMQAAHHFDPPKHLMEAERVLRPGGIFAALAWGEIILPREVSRAYAPIFDVIKPFWEPERNWVISGYRGLDFPGSPIPLPVAYLAKKLTPEGLETEMATWSAVQAALKSAEDFPEPDFEIANVPEDVPFTCRWPLVGQVFRV